MEDEHGKNFLGSAWIKPAASIVVRNMSSGVGQCTFSTLDQPHISEGLGQVTQPHQILVSPSLEGEQLHVPHSALCLTPSKYTAVIPFCNFFLVVSS